MNRLFWGLLFVALDVEVTLGSAVFGLFPDFVGYFLMMKGMETLAEESAHFSGGRHWAFALALLSIITYGADLLNLSAMDRVRMWMLGLAGHGAGVFLQYKLVAGIRQMEDCRDWELQSEKLKAMWLIQAVMSTVWYLLGWVPLVGIFTAVAATVTAVCLLAAMYNVKKRYANAMEKERKP